MKSGFLFGLLAAALVLANSVFIVNEQEHAILFQFGAVKRADFEPGLHFKMPFVQNVRKFDNRLLAIDSEPERYLTSERKDVLVDFYVQWRIDNVSEFYQATAGDEQQATQRLIAIVREPLRQAFNERTLQALVADRGTVITQVVRNANEAARALGIAVVDVRILRIDLPDEVSEPVFRRMRAERQQVANDLRATGQEAAEKIRSDADRQVTVLLAEARGAASVSSFSTCTRGARRWAALSSSGAMIRHGPHQAAQKSTSTGSSVFSSMRRKPDSSTGIARASNKGRWQRPQFGCPSMRAASSRLVARQCGQTTWMRSLSMVVLQASDRNASRVRFSGALAVTWTSSSMRTPPKRARCSTSAQSTAPACGPRRTSSSSRSRAKDCSLLRGRIAARSLGGGISATIDCPVGSMRPSIVWAGSAMFLRSRYSLAGRGSPS